MQKNKSTYRRLLPVWFAVLTFIFTELAAAFPAMTEKIYSEKIYIVIASVLSRISSVFPFSLDDIFYLFLIAGFFVLTGLLIFRKIKVKKYFLVLLNSLALVYTLFYWLWGFNYFREHLNERLQIPEQSASTEKFRAALDHLIKSANSYYPDTFKIRRHEIDSLIEDGYRELSSFLDIDYPQGIRRPKNITFSKMFASAGISGYFGPFFNEIHLNKYLLPVELPWTMAHEKSHQFGITSEAEANFYAWFVCNSSSSKQVRYAGNLNVLFYFLYDARKLSDYRFVLAKLDKGVREDMDKIIDHWAGMRNESMERAASKANDTYLKTNKVEKGIDDYDGVVKYVTEYLTLKK